MPLSWSLKMWIRQPAPVLSDDQHTYTSSKWRSAFFGVLDSMTIDDCFCMFGAGCISSVWRLLSKCSRGSLLLRLRQSGRRLFVLQRFPCRPCVLVTPGLIPPPHSYHNCPRAPPLRSKPNLAPHSHPSPCLGYSRTSSSMMTRKSAALCASRSSICPTGTSDHVLVATKYASSAIITSRQP